VARTGEQPAVVIPPGRPINYGVVDARSQDKLPFALLECGDDTPAELVPGPDAKGPDRCVAAQVEDGALGDDAACEEKHHCAQEHGAHERGQHNARSNQSSDVNVGHVS
jgi:hypothetical protein